MWLKLGLNPQQWDDKQFRALKISDLNHSATEATIKNICGAFQCNGGKLEESEGYNFFFIISCVLEYNGSALAVNRWVINCGMSVSSTLCTRDIVYFTTDLQTMIYYSTIHS